MTVQPSPYTLTIGDIGVTEAWVVTPYGTAPLRGSQWTVRDSTFTGERIPTYAIVLAVVFAVFCLLGLLFLLIKEPYYTGYVEVSVNSGDLHHVTQLQVWQPAQAQQLHDLVNQARAMALTAPEV